MRETRAVTPVIGVVLLFGLVAIGSIGVFVVGGTALTDIEERTASEQVEQSFLEFGHQMDTVTTTSDSVQTVNLDVGEHGALARTETGSYNITAINQTSGETRSVANGTIGTVLYEGDDGTTYAYEAGGVFRETGEETRLISSPAFAYDPVTETLTFPMTTVTEEKTLSAGEVGIHYNGSEREPKQYVENHQIGVEIESEHCWGWEQYFAEEANQAAIDESCAEGDEGTVSVMLGFDDPGEAFSEGTTLPAGDDSIDPPSGNNNHSFGDVGESNPRPLDDEIHGMIDSANENDSDYQLINESTDTTNISAGEYFVDGDLDTEIMNDSVEFNLSEGNTTLVIDGDIDTGQNGEITTTGDDGDNNLRIYMNGSLTHVNGGCIGPGPDCWDDGSVETVQLYGTSTSSAEFENGNSKFKGLLYLASDGEVDTWSHGESEQVLIGTGNPHFEGAIVADSIDEHSSNENIEIEEVDDVQVLPEDTEIPPQITYLNVVTHEVDVENR